MEIIKNLSLRHSRCIRCRIRMDLCICAQIEPIEIRSEVVCCMHRKEQQKASNTVHFLKLACPQVDIRIQGVRDAPVDLSDLLPKDPWVLSPYGNSVVLSQRLVEDYRDLHGRTPPLLVPDGNWNQAKHMMRRVKGIAQMQAVRLVAPLVAPQVGTISESVLKRSRRSSSPDRWSTIEAIALALSYFEGPEVTEKIMRLHELSTNALLAMRGKYSVKQIKTNNLIQKSHSS